MPIAKHVPIPVSDFDRRQQYVAKSDAARERGVSLSTVQAAIDAGKLNTRTIGTIEVVVVDALYAIWLIKKRRKLLPGQTRKNVPPPRKRKTPNWTPHIQGKYWVRINKVWVKCECIDIHTHHWDPTGADTTVTEYHFRNLSNGYKVRAKNMKRIRQIHEGTDPNVDGAAEFVKLPPRRGRPRKPSLIRKVTA